MSLEVAESGAVNGAFAARLTVEDEVTIDSSGTLRRALRCCCSRILPELDVEESVDDVGGDSAGDREPYPGSSLTLLGDKEGTGTLWDDP